MLTARTYARETGVKRFHLVSGRADRNDPRAVAAFKKSVTFAAETLGAEGVEVMLEPINPRDIPGLFLNDFDFAEQIIRELALPNVWLQFDIYHRQIIHGDVVTGLRQQMPLIRHVQIASVPSRNEPDGEELNYPFLFEDSTGSASTATSAPNIVRAARRWTGWDGLRSIRASDCSPDGAQRNPGLQSAIRMPDCASLRHPGSRDSDWRKPCCVISYHKRSIP